MMCSTEVSRFFQMQFFIKQWKSIKINFQKTSFDKYSTIQTHYILAMSNLYKQQQLIYSTLMIIANKQYRIFLNISLFLKNLFDKIYSLLDGSRILMKM